MNELQEENTSKAKGGTAETAPTPPEDKGNIQPEEGDLSDLHRSGSSPNDAVDETAQGKEDAAVQDKDGIG